VIATVTLGPSGVLQPALVGLEEPAYATDLVIKMTSSAPAGVLRLAFMGLEEPGERIAHAPDLVLVTPMALMGLGESGRRGHAPDLVLVTRLELLLGVEEPGGSRAVAPNFC
jgi:hypothetical protein